MVRSLSVYAAPLKYNNKVGKQCSSPSALITIFTKKAKVHLGITFKHLPTNVKKNGRNVIPSMFISSENRPKLHCCRRLSSYNMPGLPYESDLMKIFDAWMHGNRTQGITRAMILMVSVRNGDYNF